MSPHQRPQIIILPTLNPVPPTILPLVTTMMAMITKTMEDSNITILVRVDMKRADMVTHHLRSQEEHGEGVEEVGEEENLLMTVSIDPALVRVFCLLACLFAFVG